jgi:hypothetical protein
MATVMWSLTRFHFVDFMTGGETINSGYFVQKLVQLLIESSILEGTGGRAERFGSMRTTRAAPIGLRPSRKGTAGPASESQYTSEKRVDQAAISTSTCPPIVSLSEGWTNKSAVQVRTAARLVSREPQVLARFLDKKVMTIIRMSCKCLEIME